MPLPDAPLTEDVPRGAAGEAGGKGSETMAPGGGGGGGANGAGGPTLSRQPLSQTTAPKTRHAAASRRRKLGNFIVYRLRPSRSRRAAPCRQPSDWRSSGRRPRTRPPAVVVLVRASCYRPRVGTGPRLSGIWCASEARSWFPSLRVHPIVAASRGRWRSRTPPTSSSCASRTPAERYAGATDSRGRVAHTFSWCPYRPAPGIRSEEHTSELQSRVDLVCRLLLEKKK